MAKSAAATRGASLEWHAPCFQTTSTGTRRAHAVLADQPEDLSHEPPRAIDFRPSPSSRAEIVTPNAGEETLLEGVLIPISWGLAGEVLGLSLMTDDERDHPIDRDSGERHGLRGHLRKRVRLRAIASSDGTLRILGIEPL